jgi:RNA polymerase sigma-70 factor (ECF subfamily)
MTAAPLSGDGPERLLQHAEALRRLARRLVRDDAEADDLVQETWTSVLEKPRAHEPAAGWRRWLFGVARNIARERRRSEGRRTRREQTAARPEGGEIPALEISEQLETFRMLADELSRLDEPYRSTLYRRFFESHSNARIAADDGITEASVRSRSARGLALLRERLDRRQRDGRGAWLVLLRRIAGEERPAAPPLLVLSGAVLLSIAVVVVTGLLAGRSRRDGGAEQHAALAPGATLPLAGAGDLAGAGPDDAAGSTRVTLAQAPLDDPPSLRFVDLRTREPLGGYAIHMGVVGTGEGRSAMTRADGSIDLPVTRGTFDLAVTLIDDARLDADRRAHSGGRAFAWTIPPVHFGPEDRACTVEVAVGPRFELRFDPPLEASNTVSMEGLHAELDASDRGSMRATSRAPLRAPLEPGGHAWVRFLDEAAYLGGAAPYRLRVADDAGLVCGEAQVDTLVGAPRQPVTISLDPRGAVRIDVSDARGAVVGARLTLVREGRVIARASSEAGSVVFRWLDPAAHELWIDRPGEDRTSVLVPVEPGRMREQRVVIPSRPSGGRVAGSSRPFNRAVRFVLENDATHEQRETEGRNEDGRTTFAFENVPEGPWTLRAHAPGVWRWKPAELKVVPPATGLAIEPVDLSAADVRAIKFRAFDAETGDRVDHFQVDFQCDAPAGERATRITGFGNLVFESVPLDAHLDWSLAAEGYRPAHGGRDALQRKGPQDLVRVDLVRGWERTLSVRNARTRAPLSGARVVVDGAPAGATNDQGTLVLARPSAPRHIAVELDGWRNAGGSIEADGTWTSETPFTLAALLAPER